MFWNDEKIQVQPSLRGVKRLTFKIIKFGHLQHANGPMV